MNKISVKKLAVLVLEVLVIAGFALVAFMAIDAEAHHDRTGAYYRVYRGERTGVPPYVASLSPNSAPEMRERVQVIVGGYGFEPTSIARVNGQNRVTTFIDSDHLITEILPSDFLGNQSSVLINVYNPRAGEYSNASGFALKNPASMSSGWQSSHQSGVGVATGSASVSSSGNTNQNSGTGGSVSANSGSNRNQSGSAGNSSAPQNTSKNGSADAKGKTNGTNGGGVNGSVSETSKNYGALTATAILGDGNSFWPSGLLQWILVFVMLILIITLWRYLNRSPEKYFSKPMKHA